jgi:hypothetical protein
MSGAKVAENLTRWPLRKVKGNGPRMAPNRNPVAVVAPTSASARSAAAFLKKRLAGAVTACSLADYLALARAPRRMVLCPVGRSLEREIDFIRAARERALWEPPGDIVFDAIEGLLGSLPPAPTLGRRGTRQASERNAALLLEGLVTSKRARAALASDARLWIVEHPRRVRVNRPLMERLQKTGVRWLALDPVILVAVLASPRLAEARSRWKHLFPAGTRLWIRPE